MNDKKPILKYSFKIFDQASLLAEIQRVKTEIAVLVMMGDDDIVDVADAAKVIDKIKNKG